MTKVYKFAFLFWSFLYIVPGGYAITFEDAVFPELATNARALALGNAYMNKVDDSSSAFYNPAGLGTIRYGHFHLSNFHMELNKGWVNASTSGDMAQAVTGVTKAYQLEGLRQLLLENRGTVTHARVHATPNLTTRFFTLGYLAAKRTRAAMPQDDEITPDAPPAKFEYADRFDYGPYMGLNTSFFGGVVKIGVTAIYLGRHELIGEQDKDTEFTLTSSDYKKGNALILTWGNRLTLPIAMLPTFSLVMHNAAGKSFTERDAGAPDSIKRSVDVGFSLTPGLGKSTRLHLEVNYKDASNKFKDIPQSRKIIAGMELDLSRVFFFRGGYGDAYGCAGLGIRTKLAEFDLATYAVDATPTKFRGKEDRRFAMTMSTGF